MKQGMWNVLLVLPDCPDCLRMIGVLEAGGAENVVVIVVPSGSGERELQTKYAKFMLDNRNNWFLTPILVRIAEGICEEIRDDVDGN